MQEWIYINNEDNTSRYVLGTKGDKPVFCFGINPSTAEPDNLDPTLRSVSAISSSNGYDSWIMFNVYPKRDTVFDDIALKVNEIHQLIKEPRINLSKFTIKQCIVSNTFPS